MEIHYRWHALYGRRLRRYYSEKRVGADIVVVEGEPGVAIVVAAWMLDRAACAGMEIGEPVLALADLHRLLSFQGLRQVLSDDAGVIEETRNEERATAITVVKSPLQLSMALEALELTGISAAERPAMFFCLAHLILEAAGVEIEEVSDDGR